MVYNSPVTQPTFVILIMGLFSTLKSFLSRACVIVVLEYIILNGIFHVFFSVK